MRIVAGDLKGRAIKSPSEKTTRPTTDRVRESIFSSVYSRMGELRGAHVLDAFAGSGALGIEALSRGAATCVCFEHDTGARKVLAENLSSLGLKAPRAHVRAGDAFASQGYGGPFSLVLLDPPYSYEPSEIHALVAALAAAGELDQSCTIVYEHAIANKDAVTDEFEDSGEWLLTGQKKYGKIGVTYLEYKG